MKILATLIYIIVQILFIPFAIVGAIFVFVRQTYTSKRLGVSGTAIEIINGRWTMDLFGIREDKASGQLAWALPNNSLIGMWMALFPLWLRHKISGDLWLYPTVKARGKEGLANLVINRTLYFDEVINRAVGHTEQFVTMGAGFDTRSYGVFKEAQWKCFELDQEKTQNLKIEQLKHADIDADHVTFVTVDFQTESWSDKLKAAGYDPSKKTIFLWEGVTLYISEQDVRHTLRELKVNAPAGSVLVTDIYALSFVSGEYEPRMKPAYQALKITDEELGFGLDFSSDHHQSLKTFVESEGLKLGETYFMAEKLEKGSYMVVAEILIE